MRVLLLLIFYLLATSIETKTVKKEVRLANFYKDGPFIFMTKLHIGAGYGQIDIIYTKGDEIPSQSFYSHVSVGVVNSTEYGKFSTATTCADKERLLYKKERLNFRQERSGMKHIGIHDLKEEQLWYFYIFSCSENAQQLAKSNEEINFVFSVTNNGSHFGQNDQILYAYIVLFIIWGLLIIKFSFPIASLLSFNNPDGLKLTIFGGLGLIGGAYIYRLIHLILYNLDGSGIYIFQMIYVVMKNAGEAIITTAIVSLSWGWSLVHLNSNQSYIIIGFLAGIINIVSLILSSLTEEHEELFHHYETVPGIIILILRVVMFLIFITGIISCLKATSGKLVYFIRKLAVIGGAYLLSWPITVFIVEMTLPNYMHYEIITFMEETVHICACTLLCNMISYPESAYRKVSLHDDDNPLRIEDYHKK